MECVWFVFSPLIQKELDQVKLHWNTHYIRHSRHDTTAGRPDELFFLPSLSGYENQGILLSNYDIDKIVQQHDPTEAAMSVMGRMDEELKVYFLYVIQNLQVEYPPRDWRRAEELFHAIICAST